MSTPPATFASDEPAHRWRAPSRSVATRRPDESPRWSGRPILVEPNDNRELIGESDLEAKAALILLARPDCARLFEQPAPVPYRDLEGIMRRHTFDLLLVLKSGRRIAVAVKPKAIAEKHGLKALVTLIARQMDPAFANGALLMTDAMMPREDVQNGGLIHDARRLPDPELDARVRAVAEGLNGASTIACIVRAAGLEGHDQGFYTVARAIGDGILVPTRSGLIDPEMTVRRAVHGGPP
ncbi:MAG: hypothetical protein PGN25_19955 [Methylorubrum populi]